MNDVLARLHAFDPIKIGLEGYGKMQHDYYER